MVRSPWNRGWAALALGATLAFAPQTNVVLAHDFDEPIRVAQAAPPSNPAANALISKDAFEITRKPNVTPADLEKIIELCQKGIDEGASAKMKRYGETLMSWALNRRGQNWLDDGQTEAALADFEKAISLDPSKHLPYHNRGYIRASQGNLEGALSDFNRTIELKPEFVKGWINRGELYYAVGSWDKAVADYTEALRLQPRQADVQNQRGHAYYKAGRRQAALRDYSRAIELDPRLVTAYINRGDLYSDVGYFERAANDYRTAISIDGESSRAYVSAAWLMATCGDPKFRDAPRAIEAAEKALKLVSEDDPFRHRYLDVLAAAQANAGKFEDAARLEAEAIESAPQDVRGFYEARLALYKKNEPYRDVLKAGSAVEIERQARRF